MIEIANSIRSNIRVEIKNNIENAAMDVTDKHDKSAGDSCSRSRVIQFDSEDVDAINKSQRQKSIESSNWLKLQQRAERFQKKWDETDASNLNDFTTLHSSLGVDETNERINRFDTIHMRGIRHMLADDVFDYFRVYAPHSIEWLDVDSCNVTWQDAFSAQKVLNSISQPIKGLPVRSADCFEDDTVDTITYNRFEFDKCIDAAEIPTEIPPGFWRLGKHHAKASHLLVRFAQKTDKHPFKTELFSRYYRTNAKISVNSKTDMQHGNYRNAGGASRNPWKILAKNWDEDIEFREHDHVNHKGRDGCIPPKSKNTGMQNRLGFKRCRSDEDDKHRDSKVPRMRMYADEEEEKQLRRRILTTITTQIDKIEKDEKDLRSKLNNIKHANKSLRFDGQQHNSKYDLGLTLKNRTKRMQYAVNSNSPEELVKDGDDLQTITSRKRNELYYEDCGTIVHNEDSSASSSEHETPLTEYNKKPKSKIAVVIKTQRNPTLASAVHSSQWSAIQKNHRSESESSNDWNSVDSENN